MITSTLLSIGLDLSLTGTGYTALTLDFSDDKPPSLSLLAKRGFTTSKKAAKKWPANLIHYEIADPDSTADRLTRLLYITRQIQEWISLDLATARTYFSFQGKPPYISTMLTIEDYAFSRASSRATDLHELGGLVKTWALQNHPFRLIPPSFLKKSMGLGGKAEKHEMVAKANEIFKEFDFDLRLQEGAKKCYGEDLADSCLLAFVGLCNHRPDLLLHPEACLHALKVGKYLQYIPCRGIA